MLKKLLITGGIALAGYVINEVRKQYDKNVNDYNTLVERYNEISDFMDNCNFYTYKNPNASDKTTRYVTETQTRQDGSIQIITHDRATGFTIISSKDA